MAAAALVAALLSGCGGGSDSSEGRALRGSYLVFPDYLDPALSFTAEGWTAMQNTYIPLLTYAHANGTAGTRLIPGLARSLPKIDRGGRRYTLFLRPGLKYSNGTPVRASDFKFAVERLFRLNSAASPFYTGIVGAARFAKTKRGDIRGIRTDDRSGRIELELVEPSGIFSYLLGLTFAAPVPPSTPAEDQTADPPQATGPYEITAVKPGRSWEYRRNPVWATANSEAMPDLPSGHVDAIRIEVASNPATQLADVERGETDWMFDPPSPGRYGEVKRKYGGTQFRAAPTISIFYFWLNTQRPPFDDLRVRRALNYAVDPAALERIYAGSLTATHQVLPPQMPGYRRFDLYPHDLAKAKRLIAEADPRDRDVTIWVPNISPNNEAAEYFEQVLRQLGFQTHLKAVNASNYVTLIGNSSTPELDAGWAAWLLDYPHPNDYFQPQLSGESIVPVGNSNWAHFDDPAINAKIRRLAREQLGPRQEAGYAKLDREVMEQAPWVPFGNRTLGTFVSSEIDLDKVILSPTFGVDLTSFEFK